LLLRPTLVRHRGYFLHGRSSLSGAHLGTSQTPLFVIPMLPEAFEASNGNPVFAGLSVLLGSGSKPGMTISTQTECRETILRLE